MAGTWFRNAILAAMVGVTPLGAFPAFHPVTLDPQVTIGYGVAVADVDGDGRPDILLADKDRFVWYQNPTWQKHLLAEQLTRADNVCIAARDIDGDGKAEIAVGGEWNPGDTVNSGAVFYLVPPADRTRAWSAVALPHEPTVHRMHWVRESGGAFALVVVPLHGRGNKGGEGAGARILAYPMTREWRRKIEAAAEAPSSSGLPLVALPTVLVNDDFHSVHNFEVIPAPPDRAEDLLVASKEGVSRLTRNATGWESKPQEGMSGAGEVRLGQLADRSSYVATVEPMHGNQLVVYTRSPGNDHAPWHRRVLQDSFVEAHALACGDLLGLGSDQIVVGWRGRNQPDVKVGIKLFAAAAPDGTAWQEHLLDDNGMACEDLRLADLDGDGRIDVVAAGRATRNLKVYFNRAD